MNTHPKPMTGRMNAEAFVNWAMEQPQGRFELVRGEVVGMTPERAVHALTKLEAAVALRAAVRASGLGCQIFGDGMSVLIDDNTVYEPDAQVRCGPRLPNDAVTITGPIIVVEVLSPSTGKVDSGKKLTGYFTLPSVQHYLVLDPDDRTVKHYLRDGAAVGGIGMRSLEAGADGAAGADLVLDPPGLRIPLATLFEEP